MARKEPNKWTVGKSIMGSVLLSAAAYRWVLRPWMLNWGATLSEVRRYLPGDELVPKPRTISTRAISIQASAIEIWPWLVQIGYQRGGWYSYDAIEKALGAADFVDSHSAMRIIPELQNLKAGDEILIAPQMPFKVISIQPERALVLNVRVDLQSGSSFELSDPLPENYLNISWAFFLDEHAGGTTRLIIRFRSAFAPGLGNWLVYGGFLEPGQFLMERKMLLGIKSRVEAPGLPVNAGIPLN